MGHENEGGPPVALQGEQQVNDLPTRRLVEIACGLVGDENRRIGRNGPGDGDALLLAARELGGIVVEAVAEADGLEFRLGPCMGFGLVGEFEGQRHVLQGRHGRHEVEGLKHDADAPTAKPRQGILVEAAEIGAFHHDGARIRPFQAGHHHKESRFAGARRTDEAHRLARRDIEGDSPQDVDAGRTASEAEIEAGEGNGGGAAGGVGLAGHRWETDLCGDRNEAEQSRGFAGMRRCSESRPAGTAFRAARQRLADMARGAARRHGRGCMVGLMALFAALGLTASPGRTASGERPVSLVAFGDSLTAGYRLPGTAAFPAVLERVLRHKGRAVTVANAGVSGDTSTGGLDRLDWSVPDGTDGVILELGANDMLRGTDPAVTRKALDTIIARLKARNIPVMLAGMKASSNLGPDYVARFDAIYPDLARTHGLILYPFFLDGIAGDKAYNLDDRLHPNVKGVETIVAGILPSVETFLDRLQAVSR